MIIKDRHFDRHNQKSIVPLTVTIDVAGCYDFLSGSIVRESHDYDRHDRRLFRLSRPARLRRPPCRDSQIPPSSHPGPRRTGRCCRS